MAAAPDQAYLSPSPSPSPSPGDHDLINLLKIFALIIVGVIAMSLLHVLGSLRRMSSHKLLHPVVLGAHTLSYLLVSYTLGLMQHSDYYFYEFPVWAVCLFMLLGGTDNLMACNLNEVDNWKSFQMKHLFNGGLVIYIVARYDKVTEYRKPLWAILFVNVFQSCVRINSMKMASKSNLLSKTVKPIVDYMEGEDKGQLTSATTMKGYRYVVAGEYRMRSPGKQPLDPSSDKEVEDMKITTVEQIWGCHGTLLCSERGMQLKDICLSMALSKMLNRRFAGFPLAEAGLEKTHLFVFQGLLEEKNRYERAFRVIEVELAFVYDLYYTRYPFLYKKVRHFALCPPVAMVSLCSWLTYVLFKKHRQQKIDNPPLYATVILMAVVTLLEAFQLYLHIASNWFKVALIRSYVTRPALQKSGCFSQMTIGLALRLKTFRAWGNKLGQYSLLHDFDSTSPVRNCIHYLTLCLVNKAKKGCKRRKFIKLSNEVKKSIVDCLIISKGRLTNGASSLQENGVHGMLSWACEAGDEKVAHTILVWHVATTICKHKLEAALAKDHKKMAALSDTASSLSNYCAYLIAFAPDLLPGHSFDTASKLVKSIEEALDLEPLVAKTMDRKCEILLSIRDTNINDNVIVVGAHLARQLMEGIQDRALRWKVLSDFWAEMMLYIAPCDDAQARAHLETLARGGEFITHLWALLTHAGVLKRGRGSVGPLATV
ncbi:unnamed protein product [Alopecurus aequalis]